MKTNFIDSRPMFFMHDMMHDDMMHDDMLSSLVSKIDNLSLSLINKH